MKLKSTYYIIYIYRNCASEFDRSHGPLMQAVEGSAHLCLVSGNPCVIPHGK